MNSKYVFILGWMTALAASVAAASTAVSGPLENVTGTPVVLKVRSAPCDEQGQVDGFARTGSGTLIALPSGGSAVLTSSHVIFHASRAQGYCLSVKAEGGAWEPAELLAVHGGYGLGLLSSPASLMNTDGARVADSTPAAGEALALRGFPVAANDHPITDEGSVLDSRSRRILLPHVGDVIEVDGAHSEYGMSGGGAFDKRGNYAGLISHQYLSIAPGEQARVFDRNAAVAADGVMIPLLVSSPVILEWLSLVQRGAGNMAEDVVFQVAGLTSIRFGGVQIREKRCGDAVSAKRFGVVSSGASGVGGPARGGEGVGVGGPGRGGEGVGVGGGEGPGKVCGLEFVRVAGDQVSPLRFDLPEAATWFERLSRGLGSVPRNAYSMVHPKTLKPVAIRGLYQFLTMLRQGYRPVMDGQQSVVGDNMKSAISSARSAIQRLYKGLPQSAGTDSRRELLVLMSGMTDLVESGNGHLVDTAQARRFLRTDAGGVFKDCWVDFFNIDFESSLELQKAAVKVLDLIDSGSQT